MDIVVFGGSGFLGSHVCDKLSEAGHHVTIFDIRPSNYLRPNQEMVVADMCDEEKISAVVKGKQIVFNFAGIADLDDANERPIDTIKINILGNALLLEACKNAGVERYVFASTLYVYSESGGFYRCSKQACELYIEAYQQTYGLDYTILRYGSLYGERSGTENAIYRFIREALTDKKIRYYGSPEALREYIHVEDAATCSVEILNPAYANQNIILTGHQPMKVGNVLKMIAEILKEDIQFDYESEKHSSHYEVTPYVFSPRMGRKMTPRMHVDLGQGILRLIEHIHRELHTDLENVQGYLMKE